MYTNEDLYLAVNAGIFKKEDVDEFRLYIAKDANTNSVDEENFRLISGFNDIFVSISALVLLISSWWLTSQIAPVFGFLIAASISWFLSEFFILKKKLALPAIILLASFVVNISIFSGLALSAYGINNEYIKIVLLCIGAIAAWLHWIKFKVPITVAAGIGSIVVCIFVILAQLETIKNLINLLIFVCGLLTFAIAMIWDGQDPNRKTRKSDVAFWLHLLAAPLVVHPVFAAIGILDGEASIIGIVLVIVMYIVLAAISISVDRRALMVSSLIYVIYAFNQLFNSFGMINSGLAMSGIFISSVLLLLSAFWQKSRLALLQVVPNSVVKRLPPAI
ncbi:hypothetical protein EDC56_3683 [Sinobacterium caligoides]|uniref:Membrane protein DUF2157 n=1 Tax=Sinobacterium caligoides TaxID=933926 RepID=A0A3N2DE64_9GAMM|nr:hypothetical protein [Sinobacterium caligoides]ROR98012.1 hypothetical protein EDC56_3683 [Sinobacterium caligoides]